MSTARILGRDGGDYLVRPFRWTDVDALAKLIADPRFDYPYLTGARTPDGAVRPRARALHYALSIFIAERLGELLFRRRRHWFRVIAESGSGRLIGMVLLDEIVRHPPGEWEGIGAALLKGASRRRDARLGDAEIGMFISPDYRRLGLVETTLFVLVEEVSRSSGADGLPIVRRLWAETGAGNVAARHMLEKLGLRPVDHGDDAQPSRFDRSGAPVRLVCYRQVGDLEWRARER